MKDPRPHHLPPPRPHTPRPLPFSVRTTPAKPSAVGCSTFAVAIHYPR